MYLIVILPADCASKGGTYASSADSQSYATGVTTSLNNKIFRAYGQGCYDSAWLQETAIDNAINTALLLVLLKIDSFSTIR